MCLLCRISVVRILEHIMGGTTLLIIGENIEEQLAPFKITEETYGTTELSYFYWKVGPFRYANRTDWRHALRLREGHKGDARFVSGDEPPGATYSAQKQAIDFQGIKTETEVGAGLVWDAAHRIGIPKEFYLYAEQRGLPPAENFHDQLSTFMEGEYPGEEALMYAGWNFLDSERLIYPRERYIDLCIKSRIAESYILINGKLLSYDSIEDIRCVQSPVLRWDRWLDFTAEFIETLSDTTLITQAYLKQ